MNPHLQTIEANLPELGNPSTCASAATAIATAQNQLWAELAATGSLTALAAAARARNTLHTAHAASLILQSLAAAAGDAAAAAAFREAGAAWHLLSLLDVLCKPLEPEVAASMQQALGRERLMSHDYSELNALRAQPLFVAFALDTFLALPAGSTAPHTAVAYLLNLTQMDGTDADTAEAFEQLLRAKSSRQAIWRGMRSEDMPQLCMVAQLLKRCVGGTPGILGGFATSDREEDPPYTLAQLLELGAEQPLVAACNRVASLVRARSGVQQMRSRLCASLLDIVDLATSPAGSQRAAAVGGGRSWPDALVAAHVQLVVEVVKQAPLGKELAHMRPYAKSAAASRAVEQLGADAMSAIVAVLANSDLSDTLMLGQVDGSYQIVHGLVSHSQQLAQRALKQGGVAHTILRHLKAWARSLAPGPNDDAGCASMHPSTARALASFAASEGRSAAKATGAALQLLKTLLKAPDGLAALKAAAGMSTWTELLSGMEGREELCPLVRECMELMSAPGNSGVGGGTGSGTPSAQQGRASGSRLGGSGAGADSNTRASTPGSQPGSVSSSQQGDTSSALQQGGASGIAEGGTASAQHDDDGANTGRRQRVCAACSSSGAHMKRCARCMAVWYCNAACQRLDWAAHKRSCVEPA